MLASIKQICLLLLPIGRRAPVLCITNSASLMHLLSVEADVIDGRSDILIGNITFPLIAMALQFTPLLRGVVLVGEAALRLCFNHFRLLVAGAFGSVSDDWIAILRVRSIAASTIRSAQSLAS